MDSPATAFVPATAHGLFTASAPTRTRRVSPRRAPAPARATRRSSAAALRMTGGSPGGGEEEVEETVSLKDLKARLQKAQDQEQAAASGVEVATDPEEDLRSEKEKEIERLRAAEKFIEVDEGKYECTACGYTYDPANGEPRNGIAADTAFEAVPDSYTCPQCRTPKRRFVSRKKIIAGFAVNQTYGFGSNTMTGGEKSLLIFGALAVCVLLLLSGYALN